MSDHIVECDNPLSIPLGRGPEAGAARSPPKNEPMDLFTHNASDADPSLQAHHPIIFQESPMPIQPRALEDTLGNDTTAIRSGMEKWSPVGRGLSVLTDLPPAQRPSTRFSPDNVSTAMRGGDSHRTSSPTLGFINQQPEDEPFTARDPFEPKNLRHRRPSWSSFLPVKDGKQRPFRTPSATSTTSTAYLKNEEGPYHASGHSGYRPYDSSSSFEGSMLDRRSLLGVHYPATQAGSAASGSVHHFHSPSAQSSYHNIHEEKVRQTPEYQGYVPVDDPHANGATHNQKAPSLRFAKNVTIETFGVDADGESASGSELPHEGKEISLSVWLATYIPSRLCLYFLWGIPWLYFTRFADLFEDTNLRTAQMERMALESVLARMDPRLPAFHSEAFTHFTKSWVTFVECLIKEWKTMNLISILLLSAIVSILQIEAAFSDPVVHYGALFSLALALMSLLFGCMYILRFNTMRVPHKAIRWAQETQTRTDLSNPFWNVWVILAIPAIYLVWSLLFYVLCLMALVWRAENGSTPAQLSSTLLLVVRCGISAVLGVGIACGAVVLYTFIHFAEPMNRRYKAALRDAFARQQTQKLSRPTPRPSILKKVDRGSSEDQNSTYQSHLSTPSLVASLSSSYPPGAQPAGVAVIPLETPLEVDTTPLNNPPEQVHFDGVKYTPDTQHAAPSALTDPSQTHEYALFGSLPLVSQPTLAYPNTARRHHSPPEPQPPSDSSDLLPSKGPLGSGHHPSVPLQVVNSLFVRESFENLRSLEEGSSRSSPREGRHLEELPQPRGALTSTTTCPSPQLPEHASQRSRDAAMAGRPTPWPHPPLSKQLKSVPDPLVLSSASTRPYNDLLLCAPYPILYNSIQYPSALHLCYALPFLECHQADFVEQIRQCEDTTELRSLSVHLTTHLQPRDRRINTEKLVEIQNLKFRQHPGLEDTLLGTSDRELTYLDWDDLTLEEGGNELGIALMAVRDALRTASMD